MRIALCGSHRTGKTITATSIAQKLGIDYIPANVSKCSFWSAFKPSDNMTFAERIEVQEILLSEYTQHIIRNTRNKSSFILDRSPMDFLMYLLCNIDSTTSVLFDRRVEVYIDTCVQLCSEFFDVFIVIPPNIPFVAEKGKDGKVYNSKTYQEALTNSVIGSLYRFVPKMDGEKHIMIIPDDVLSVSDRLDFIMNYISSTNDS